MFEQRDDSLLPRSAFTMRVLRYAAISACMVLVSLGIGILGYHRFGRLSWLDAFQNACMILTGMGPVDPMRTPAAKIFASCYALFSGVAFLSATAVLLAPPVHRFLHHFHLDLDDEETKDGKD